MGQEPGAGTFYRPTLAFANSSMMYKGLALAFILIPLFLLLVRKPTRQRAISLLPTWVPLEIALTAYLVSYGGLLRRIYSLLRRNGGSLFGFTSRHQVLYDMPGLDRFMAQPHSTLDTTPLGWTMLVRVFGVEDSEELCAKFLDTKVLKPLFTAVERVFVNDSAATAAIEKGDVAGKAASFVTFSSRPEDMARWERSADVRVVAPQSTGQPAAVEVNFHNLTRDFGACIAIPLLYGQDFLDRYSELLDDFWKFDNDIFPMAIVGIPTWLPLKIMREGLAARSRLLRQLQALYRRIDQYQRGGPVDFGADMSDVSSVALDRNRIYAKHDFSYRHRGEVDLSILWGQNANTQQLVFWYLMYIYSTPDLLEDLRQEVNRYVKLSGTEPTRIVSIDVQALCRDCPLTKSALFETFRLTNEATSIRYVVRPITINDGERKHQIEANTWLSWPHGMTQRNPSTYPEPDKFIPHRFLETDVETGRRMARYGKLRPWGAGVGICKGRTFAEKEILSIAAAVISLWDIEPVGGTWKVPAMRPGTGVMRPVEDTRVVIKRRVLDR